ncbi:PEP-CTERM putative exosortase interaction domain-containing protein [Opitutaceae bacterium TAV1]|nr:PEP-CTERM putative exosortase interaction domain-containing protein [Opitutaceae bacterium TAV1]
MNIHKTTTVSAILLATLPALVCHAMAQTTPVFADDFSAATRTGWYSSGAVTGDTPTLSWTQNTGLTLNAASVHAVSYFDPATVGVGETLSVTMKFNVSGDTDVASGNFFRLGLYNAGANGHVNVDDHGTNGNKAGSNLGADGFISYTGYRATARFNTGSTQLVLNERRTSASNTLIINDGGNLTTPISSTNANTAGTSIVLTTNQTYTFTLSLHPEDAGNLLISARITGIDKDGNAFDYTATGSDTASIVSTFDTIAIGLASGTVQYTLNDVSVVHTTAVPEPATIAAISGLLVFAAAALIRRHTLPTPGKLRTPASRP